MNQSEFFDLADRVFDLEASENEVSNFESAVESHPDWMEVYVDQKSAMHGALGLAPIEASLGFDSGVVALWRADRIRRSAGYWAPTAFAAVAAAVGILALIQVLTAPVSPAAFGKPRAEARLENQSPVDFPSLREPLAK
ncbi:MAG: hypothetical protein JSS71_08145 [Armatimonadetes bacterium]|nr:hypothetical protein [Armatimonadota bacterium]MBX3109766.1 hypothetical protein [Fimbriimonadaceae bacterium]